MRKTGKSILIATALIIIGAIIFMGGMAVNKWDFSRLSTRKMQTVEHEITENFTNVSIIGSTADIVFEVKNDENCKVVCFEETNMAHTVSVEDGTLKVDVKNERTWLDYIGFNFSTPKITVYLPVGAYAELKIKSDTGDVFLPAELEVGSIDVEVNTGDVDCKSSVAETIKIKATTGNIKLTDVNAEFLDLTVSTGHITASGINCAGDISMTVSTGKATLSDAQCTNLTSTGNTGDITLDGVNVGNKLSIERTTGDVELNDSDAHEIWIKTNTGDVEGTLLSEKIFITNTSTGSVEVPRGTTGGVCEITTTTGDIEIDIKGA